MLRQLHPLSCALIQLYKLPSLWSPYGKTCLRLELRSMSCHSSCIAISKNILTVYTAHGTQYTAHSTQYTVQYTQYTVHSTQHTVHSTKHTVQYTQYTANSTLYTAYSTQYTVNSTQYTAHSTVYTVHSTVHYTQHNVQSTQHTVHSTLHTVHSTQYTTQHTVHCTQHTVHSTLYTEYVWVQQTSQNEQQGEHVLLFEAETEFLSWAVPIIPIILMLQRVRTLYFQQYSWCSQCTQGQHSQCTERLISSCPGTSTEGPHIFSRVNPIRGSKTPTNPTRELSILILC